MVAFNQSDVFHFGAGFDWFGGSFYRQIFNDYHRVAMLKDVAVCIFYFMRIIRTFSGVPLKMAIGTGVRTIIDGIRRKGIRIVGRLWFLRSWCWFGWGKYNFELIDY